MTDAELIALAALVNQQTVLMHGENLQRQAQGWSMAYVDGMLTPEAELLRDEIARREVRNAE